MRLLKSRVRDERTVGLNPTPSSNNDINDKIWLRIKKYVNIAVKSLSHLKKMLSIVLYNVKQKKCIRNHMKIF